MVQACGAFVAKNCKTEKLLKNSFDLHQEMVYKVSCYCGLLFFHSFMFLIHDILSGMI